MRVPPANERLKESFEPWLWSSMIAATVVHFAVLALWPEVTVAAMGIDTRDLEVIAPPEVEIPDVPDLLTRPAEPVVASVEVDEDLTIAATTLKANPPDELAPPPPGRRRRLVHGHADHTLYRPASHPELYGFSPAFNRDQRVPVWVSFFMRR